MKYFIIFSLLLIIFGTCTSAQSCPGRPGNPGCIGQRNAGRAGPGCRAINMWYFDLGSRRCRPFRYSGCGGNRNRHCTRASCQQRCR